MKPALLLFAFALAAPANAHEWYTGQPRQDGKVGSCCSDDHCDEVPDKSVVHLLGDAYKITLDPGEHRKVTVHTVYRFNGTPKLSPDGKTHVCISGDHVICIFIGGVT